MKKLLDYSWGSGWVQPVPLLPSTQLKFDLYYGTSAKTALEEEDVLLFSKQNTSYQGYKTTYTVNNSGPKYIYFVIPTKVSEVDTFTFLGFPNRFLNVGTVVIHDSEGIPGSYYMYRSEYLQNGLTFNIRID